MASPGATHSPPKGPTNRQRHPHSRNPKHAPKPDHRSRPSPTTVRTLENSRACEKLGTDLSVPRRRNPGPNASCSVASGRGALWAGLSPIFRPFHSASVFVPIVVRAVSPLVFWMRPITAQIAMKTVPIYRAATAGSDLRQWGRSPTCPPACFREWRRSIPPTIHTQTLFLTASIYPRFNHIPLSPTSPRKITG